MIDTKVSDELMPMSATGTTTGKRQYEEPRGEWSTGLERDAQRPTPSKEGRTHAGPLLAASAPHFERPG